VDVTRLLAQVEALSPAATLARGYAVVQRADDGSVLRHATQVQSGDALRIRLAHGEVGAVVSDA
jgi:exodeoxyribonuclease VII large subunit